MKNNKKPSKNQLFQRKVMKNLQKTNFFNILQEASESQIKGITPCRSNAVPVQRRADPTPCRSNAVPIQRVTCGEACQLKAIVY